MNLKEAKNMLEEMLNDGDYTELYEVSRFMEDKFPEDAMAIRRIRQYILEIETELEKLAHKELMAYTDTLLSDGGDETELFKESDQVDLIRDKIKDEKRNFCRYLLKIINRAHKTKQLEKAELENKFLKISNAIEELKTKINSLEKRLRFCPSCGTLAIDPKSKFCGICGQQIQ